MTHLAGDWLLIDCAIPKCPTKGYVTNHLFIPLVSIFFIGFVQCNMGKEITLRRRFIGIDKARAFAALFVVWGHILNPVLPSLANKMPSNFGAIGDFVPYLFPGTPAVIVFFVISGFCIHYPYTNRSLPFWQFWLARWVRILPSLLVALLAVKIVGIPKINFSDGVILWSIICELMYYTLYPGFFIISRTMSWKKQFYFALAVSSILVFTRGNHKEGFFLDIAKNDDFGPYLNWLVALPSWLAGCVLAENIKSQNVKSPLMNVIYWRILIVFSASFLMWPPINEVFGCYPGLNAFSLLVFFWLSAEISVESQKPSVFAKVGKWSYSLYLFHLIILIYLLRLFKSFDISNQLNETLERLLALPFVLLGSYLAYVLVEKKFHHYARLLYAGFSNSTSWSLIQRN